MGGIMKGGYGHMHATYGSRRRWMNVYIVMVIACLVLGCGILGLMGLHRLKERRILNLLIKERDDQILSLHHLLQKEKEHMQEVKRKTEEMKMKIYSLRAQKTELNGRVMDMQSTISSLRDEQRTIEVALQEKQNEAKLLREQHMEIKDQNPQVKALTEVIRKKEAEIEDLKHRLQLEGAKIGLVSTDEHSIVSENTKAEANISGSETMINEKKDGVMHNEEKKNPADGMESTRNYASRYREIESSMQSEEHTENGIAGRSEMTSKEEIDGLENTEERSAENGRKNADRRSEHVEPKDNYDQEQGGSSETGWEKNEYETQKTGNLGNGEQKPRDEDIKAHSADSKEFSKMDDANSRRISKSEGSDNQELVVQHKGLVKLEMQEDSHNRHYRIRGRHGYLTRAKGKRWRPIAKQRKGKRISRSDGALTMGDQGLVEGMDEIGDKLEESKPRNQDKIQNSIMGLRLQNESVSENQQFEMVNNRLPDAGHGEAMSDVRGYIGDNKGENGEDSPPGTKSENNVKPEDTEDMSNKVAKSDMSNQFGNGWEVTLRNSRSEKSHVSLDEVPKHSADKFEDTGSSIKGAVNHTEEDEQSKEEEIPITERAEDKTYGQSTNRLGRKEVAEKNEDPNGVQMEHSEDIEPEF